ncbi:Arylsulphatase [Zalerion maritima]|uniref:Arylsulphatase n=1 Tax=Zalerion maritima TaxID=339359 RepID=A0AAD5WN35_9PEZI|nr:Arylsulphatase [Zalerion maritima]
MLFNIAFSIFLVALASASPSSKCGTPKKQPNFVFIMADDQDLHLNSLAYQPIVRERIGEQGTTFNKHFCTISLCCPSRVSLLTGKLAHNTNVTDVFPPYGGHPKFISQGLNDKYLPVWLQSAGYSTYYTGKLMNSHSNANWNNPYPAGWNGTGFLLDPATYVYNNATFQVDRNPPVSRTGECSTDIIKDMSLDFLDKADKAGAPFFIGIAPSAPRSESRFELGSEIPYFAPPVPAERHKDLFPGVKVPRGVSFNPDAPSGASWVSKLPKLNSSQIDSMDGYHRARLHPASRVHTKKTSTSPFLIRGPGIPKNRNVDFVTSHTDIAPTIFKLAGVDLRHDFDGTPMPTTVRHMNGARLSPRCTIMLRWSTGGGGGLALPRATIQSRDWDQVARSAPTPTTPTKRSGSWGSLAAWA